MSRQYMGADGTWIDETGDDEYMGAGGAWVNETVTAGGGPTYTLAADGATFTLTGQASGLKAARKMVSASATFALTGQDVALKAARKLVAGNGAFTLTGQDVTLTYSPGVTYSMTADSGAFTLTGGAVAFKAARKLTADAATFTLTGQDVGLTYSTGAEETVGGSGAGWNIDFTGIETRIVEEKSDREDRRKTIEAVYRRATGKALPDSKPVEVAAAEALPSVKPAARKRMQAELRAIAEIDASIDRLERQIESADMAYLLAEERDIVWIVSEYL
jgi:hypothetical protein